MKDIKTLLSASSSGGKVTKETLAQFCQKRLIMPIDKSPYLAFRIEIQVKVGKILKSTRECYLGKTIDDNLIVFDRTEKDPETGKRDYRAKVVHQFGKAALFSLGKHQDSSIQLIRKKKAFFGLIELKEKLGLVVKDKKDIDLLNNIVW